MSRYRSQESHLISSIFLNHKVLYCYEITFWLCSLTCSALGPNQPPIQWVPGVLSLRVKLTTHLHLVPRSNNAWSYTSTPQYVFMVWCLVKHRDNFTFFTFPYLLFFYFVFFHKSYILLFCYFVRLYHDGHVISHITYLITCPLIAHLMRVLRLSQQ
jgi:hypothetical protein